MERMLGEEYPAFLASYEEPRKFGLRVNTSKISVEDFVRTAPFHLTPIPWIPNGFYYEREDDPARHPFYYAGLYYLQEPSAMTPASVLPVQPGEKVLDLCAAPGGKATALGAKLNGQGLLVANDISASRAKALLKNLEVFGIRNSFVTNAAPAKLTDRFEGYFDKILVDAPCSGEGMFRKDIANARVWSMDKVAECAKIQHEITRRAVRMLRPGGWMLYSTCTFSAEENEQTIASLLSDCPELELLEIPWYEGFSHGMPELADGNPELKKCVRIFPHHMDGEGHFLALMCKKGGPDVDNFRGNEHPDGKHDGKRDVSKTKKHKAGKAASAADETAPLAEFLSLISGDYSMQQMEIRNGQVYCLQGRLPMGAPVPFLRNGLYFGEIRKGRFEPSQSLAMALKREEFDSVLDFEQSDERVKRYLRGETAEVEDLHPARKSGWQLVCVGGYPLGWGKLVNGTLKNKYHPGWRMPG